jgi:hypothetical protein
MAELPYSREEIERRLAELDDESRQLLVGGQGR